MERIRIEHRIAIVALFLCSSIGAVAQGQPYLCEIGLQGGAGYYVGDAAPHIFMHPREAYGIHFRYKFTKRWALQAKFSGQRITGWNYNEDMVKLDTKWTNRLYNVDLMAEFNFFRFGEGGGYDKRIKPFTPYIFAGIGMGLYNDIVDPKDKPKLTASGYIPLGIGFKWKFAQCVGLNVAWQHNIYFSDDLEGQDNLNNRQKLNGSNWFNCDITGMFTAGIVFEFARAKKACRICNW